MTIDYEPITPPGRFDALQELRLPVDMLRWAPSLLTMKARRTAHPRTAILLPGFGAGTRSMRVPVTAIYSRRDGIVAWQACIDKWLPDVRHIEVSETHVGLGFSPRVLGLVADEIARD